VTGKNATTNGGDIKGFMNTASTANNHACYVDNSIGQGRR